MKRCLKLLAAASLFVSCSHGQGIEIKESEAVSVAYDKSVELATRVAEAKSYEEFIVARQELEAYEEAMRTQIGGEDYEVFVTSVNEILSTLK